MASQKQQYTILYGRLSQEDERAGESNSIQHQRDLLEKYARDKGFENTLFLADDGYSGTNFERPSWKKIVEMIEAGEVSTLIVKDASRLGREYLQVGYYMEIYFPQKNVRFIAVNDGVDSAVESSNDFNPIRNWANELHAKDTSRKVRAVKKLQACSSQSPAPRRKNKNTDRRSHHRSRRRMLRNAKSGFQRNPGLPLREYVHRHQRAGESDFGDHSGTGRKIQRGDY